jgi:RNA polymerase sigma-70 factor (ECF subfamily)
VSDLAWIDSALTAARPQAIGALLRYFRDLDLAEEAFQDASLRALRNWPQKGPPRDPAAWLIMVGRNAAIDQVRRRSRQQALPDEDAISDLDDVETPLAERLDGSDYRDDVLRLLFICCHPDLPTTQQIALALRIVSGLSVSQIARAFVVGEAAMEQRITRAKARVAKAGVPFETPGPADRAERLGAVAAMIYLVFNEGRAWDRRLINEGLALIDKAIRHRRRGPYQVKAAIAAMHVRAAAPEETDWAHIDDLYAALEVLEPSPIVTLNRAVAVSKIKGPEAALEMIAPLEARLAGYFNYHGARGALLMQLGRAAEARRAFDQAIALATTPAQAAHIRQHLDQLAKGGAVATPRG